VQEVPGDDPKDGRRETLRTFPAMMSYGQYDVKRFRMLV